MSDIDNNKVAATSSFPVLSILGIIFIVLKLTDQIDWDWKWVLAPFWIPWIIVLSMFVIISVVVIVGQLHDTQKRKKKGVHKDGRRY